MKRSRSNEFENSEKRLSTEGVNCLGTPSNVSKNAENIAGKIETLYMENFMCHKNLEIKFNNRVNFITGKNGSGKSAIMSALILGLGGTAQLTGRGSSVSDLIKKGENHAKVSITLINDGLKSFKREIYGSRITICRKIKAGANDYECRSEKGTIISKKKEEVDNIVLAFNLQIKNPICILNQDVARNFLHSNDNKLRFSMFMKATQLEDLENIYFNTLKSLEKSKSELKKKEKGLEGAREEIAELKEKLERFAFLEKTINERNKLRGELLWSLVIAEENNLRKLLDEKNGLEQKREELIIRNNKNLTDGLEAKVLEFQKKIDRTKEFKEGKTQEKMCVQREAETIRREIDKSEALLKSLISKKERKMEEMKKVKEYLEKQDEIDSQSQSEKLETSERIKILQENVMDLAKKIADAQDDFNTTQDEYMKQKRNIENAKADLGEVEQNKRRLEIMLTESKTKGQSNMLKFGQYTVDLLSAIEEADRSGRFKRKPVGPCGKYVTLSGDPKWARAAESVISSLMDTYCCDNQEDYQVLSKIMDRICGNKQPQIIISKFRHGRHKVESRKVKFRDLPAVLDVLKFDDDTVFNTFIDQARIETKLLFETDSQAASVLTHIQNVPKNLKMGLTLNGDQYYPAPNYRTYCGNTKTPLRYFETSKGDSVKKLEAELTEARRTFAKKEKEVMVAQQEYRKVCEEAKRKEKVLRQLKQSERERKLDLNQLRDIEESRPVIKTKVVLEEELQSLKQNYENLNEKIKQCSDSLNAMNDRRTECIKKLNILTLGESAADKELNELEEKIEEKKDEHCQFLRKKQNFESQLSDIHSKLQEVTKEICKSKEALVEKVRSAKEKCLERIETQRSPTELNKLLEKREKYLKTAEKLGCRTTTEAEYQTKLELYETMRDTATRLEKTIKELTKLTVTKRRRLEVQQSRTAEMVSVYFKAILQTRGYDGHLKVDFDDKVLDIEVQPKNAKIARKDSKTLSGGERSYSTVSFILAIWKVVEMPVYFLDEFDVFMDEINRKVILELLVDHATDHGTEQYVFITPQDVSAVHPSDLVSVWRLDDPRPT